MNKLQVAITGAGGLVGSHLVDFLTRQGHSVVAVCRPRLSGQPFAKIWNETGVRLVEADVDDLKSLLAAFQGVDAVVHAAAIVDPYGSRDLIFRTNVGGTKNVLRAVKDSHIKQLILVSSLSVITGRHDQFDTKEDAPYQPCGEAYADSKIAAEEAVCDAIKSNGLSATIVRPGFIYGPGERAWLTRLINSIAEGKAMLIDGGTKETNVIYVENVSRAINACLSHDGAIGQIYNLTDGPGITKKQLFDAISTGLDLPPVRRVVPGFAARAFCEFVSSLAPLLPVDRQRELARYSRAAFRLVGQNQGFSIAKAERELGYANRVPFAEGMSETLSSVRAEKNKLKAEPYAPKVAAR